MSGTLSSEVERFLVEHIDSIAQLEVLHLLYADPPTHPTAAAVARALGVDTAWASAELDDLVRRGFLVPGPNGTAPTFRFAPSNADLGATIEQVLRAFRERRLAVIDLVANKPSRHVRGFADAFRLRKDR